MEEATPLHLSPDDPRRATAPRPVRLPVRPEQTMLPLDEGTGAVPRDAATDTGPQRDQQHPVIDAPSPEHDRPIGFALTVRARRAVAPNTLPALRVVSDDLRTRARPDGGPLEDPDDTRPARARALRRAGVPISAIASQLGADPLAITAWIGELAPSLRRQGGSGPGAGAGDVVPEPGAAGDPPLSALSRAREDGDEVAAQLARAAAADQARERLQRDPAFAVAAGLLAATATADRYAVTITTGDPRQASRVLAALQEEEPASTALVRVVLRLGPSVAADLARHRVAAQLALTEEQVAWTRWKTAPQPDAVQLLVRIAEPSLATSVAGWIDAVLEPSPEPVDLAF